MSERPWFYWLVLGSILLSTFGALVSFGAWSHVNAQRNESRRVIAQSDLDLCTSLYSNIVSTTDDGLRRTTVDYYHNLLPSLTETELANLVASSRASLLRQREKFNPKQCHSLPSQKLLPG